MYLRSILGVVALVACADSGAGVADDSTSRPASARESLFEVQRTQAEVRVTARVSEALAPLGSALELRQTGEILAQGTAVRVGEALVWRLPRGLNGAPLELWLGNLKLAAVELPPELGFRMPVEGATLHPQTGLVLAVTGSSARSGVEVTWHGACVRDGGIVLEPGQQDVAISFATLAPTHACEVSLGVHQGAGQAAATGIYISSRATDVRLVKLALR